MNIVHYDQSHDWCRLQNEVGRLLSAKLSRPFTDEGTAQGTWAPSIDLYENKDWITLDAEMPGMKREDFHLTIEQHVLTLHCERRFEKSEEADTYHHVERSYGTFSRSFTLPQTISEESVTAEYENGVLHITLAKREELKARRIEVTDRVIKSKAPEIIEAQTGSSSEG
jgi:HSP20 family protein